MKILTRYILREMIGPTTLGFLFYTSIIVMQKLFDFAGMIIRRSLAPEDVGKLLLYTLPWIIVLTVPMALLFGILIAIGRLSSDSEIIAMRALGISTRTIYLPVFLFSFAIFAFTFYLMNWVTPAGNRQFVALRAELFTSTVSTAIKPRVFYDEYENLMIYVNDVDPETGDWKGVFVADSRTASEVKIDEKTPQQAAETSPQEEHDPSALLGSGEGQRIIVAETGDLSIMNPGKQVWMNLRNTATHLWNPGDPTRYDVNRNVRQRMVLPETTNDFSGRSAIARSLREMTLAELIQQERWLRGSSDRVTHRLALVEIHKKFAIPFACLAFGVLGLPLGITNRRGGKSSGFSLSIAIIVFYYIFINNGEEMAATGKIPAAVGMWAANVVLVVTGIYLISRANRDAGFQKSEGGWLKRSFVAIGRKLQRKKGTPAAVVDEPSILNRLDITFPNIIDRYILREFLKILLLVLVSVMALFIIVDYTEIGREIRQNEIPLHVVLSYFRFQIFTVLHWTLPISVLVATLVTFGLLSKSNEVTAFKSGGMSLYRVAMPVLAVAAVISLLSYFILDFVLPYSNKRVDRLKKQIQGSPTITTTSQQKTWFLGGGRYLINFLSYHADRQELSQVQVFEFDPQRFRLSRRIYAQRAKWNGRAWVFHNGWMRTFHADNTSSFDEITQPTTLQYAETPEDFETETRSPEQMTFAQLRRYIAGIRQSGYSAEELAVKLYTKTSWPAISIVMVLIALPFAFKTGKKGALYGVAIAMVIGFIYWGIFILFTKFGEVGNLPPILSAWSANILFAIAAVYLFLHVET